MPNFDSFRRPSPKGNSNDNPEGQPPLPSSATPTNHSNPARRSLTAPTPATSSTSSNPTTLLLTLRSRSTSSTSSITPTLSSTTTASNRRIPKRVRLPSVIEPEVSKVHADVCVGKNGSLSNEGENVQRNQIRPSVSKEQRTRSEELLIRQLDVEGRGETMTMLARGNGNGTTSVEERLNGLMSPVGTEEGGSMPSHQSLLKPSGPRLGVPYASGSTTSRIGTTPPPTTPVTPGCSDSPSIIDMATPLAANTCAAPTLTPFGTPSTNLQPPLSSVSVPASTSPVPSSSQPTGHQPLTSRLTPWITSYIPLPRRVVSTSSAASSVRNGKGKEKKTEEGHVIMRTSGSGLGSEGGGAEMGNVDAVVEVPDSQSDVPGQPPDTSAENPDPSQPGSMDVDMESNPQHMPEQPTSSVGILATPSAGTAAPLRAGWFTYLGFPGPSAASGVLPTDVVPTSVEVASTSTDMKMQDGHASSANSGNDDAMQVDSSEIDAEANHSEPSEPSTSRGPSLELRVSPPTPSVVSKTHDLANVARANEAVVNSINQGWWGYGKSLLGRGGLGEQGEQVGKAIEGVPGGDDQVDTAPKEGGQVAVVRPAADSTVIPGSTVEVTMETMPTSVGGKVEEAKNGSTPTPGQTMKGRWFRTAPAFQGALSSAPTGLTSMGPPPAPILAPPASSHLPPSTAALPIGPAEGTSDPARLLRPQSSRILKDQSAGLLKQNLVLPTFEQTFDRPPRKVRKKQPEPEEASSPTPAAGMTTFTWKALGAVTSYVRNAPPQPDKNVAKTEASSEHVKDEHFCLPRMQSSGAASWEGIRRVVVVGVHGWYPNKNVQIVTGVPRSSAYFASMMGQAILNQFEADHGIAEDQLEKLTYIPLDGEGTVDTRVDRLFKQYLSKPEWIADMRRADAVFFAAHSQGCIVTAHLMCRLIMQGHLRTPDNHESVARCEWAFGPIVLPDHARGAGKINRPVAGSQKLLLLAMCGVHQGPFASMATSAVLQPYLHWFESPAAKELFEFQDTTTTLSCEYQRSMSLLLDHGVKVLLLASLDDQMVPIYSATFTSATHPLILRALYIDARTYAAEDWMTSMLVFCMMLRNAGLDDQGLMTHLSEVTAGGLTGVGHSAPYEDLGGYNLAVRYLLTTDSPRDAPSLDIEPFASRDARNDYELPWILRGVMDSTTVRELFQAELDVLKDGILDWRPSTKALKDIKKRLEPMAGRAALRSRTSRLLRSPSTASLASSDGRMKDGGSDGKVTPAGSPRASDLRKHTIVGLGHDW